MPIRVQEKIRKRPDHLAVVFIFNKARFKLFAGHVMTNKKEIYKEFCSSRGMTEIFLQPWWLDAVCQGNDWDVSLSYDDQGNVNGVLPYMVEKKGIFRLLRMPPLTPFLGVWLAVFNGEKLHHKYSHEKKIMSVLIDGLPDFHYFAQKFSPDITNWYPFFLNGFDQTTSYTYIIHDIKDHERVWNNMKNTIRTIIRKAENMLSIEETDQIDHHIALQTETFDRQGMKTPFPGVLPKAIFSEVKERAQGTLLKAVDDNNNIHATCLLVWDSCNAYNLMLGVNTELRNSGAVQLLIWEGIKLVSSKVDVFNFEGSMLPHIEPVFRHFGGVQTPYFRISKDRNKGLRLLRSILGK